MKLTATAALLLLTAGAAVRADSSPVGGPPTMVIHPSAIVRDIMGQTMRPDDRMKALEPYIDLEFSFQDVWKVTGGGPMPKEGARPVCYVEGPSSSERALMVFFVGDRVSEIILLTEKHRDAIILRARKPLPKRYP